jgi:hypothetical protein
LIGEIGSRFSMKRTPGSQISESHPLVSRNPHTAPAGGGDGSAGVGGLEVFCFGFCGAMSVSRVFCCVDVIQIF